jgi:hypothetical protein
MPLKMRPTGLGHGVYKDDIDYAVLCGEWCIGRIYQTRTAPSLCAGSGRCTHLASLGKCGPRTKWRRWKWRRRKGGAKAPNLRDKLSQAFLTAFDADFHEHGVDVIQQLRLKDPVRYAELAGRLIMAVEQPADPNSYASCQSEEEICRKLLAQVGVADDQLTPDMLRLAEEANLEFVNRLIGIGGGH